MEKAKSQRRGNMYKMLDRRKRGQEYQAKMSLTHEDKRQVDATVIELWGNYTPVPFLRLGKKLHKNEIHPTKRENENK